MRSVPISTAVDHTGRRVRFRLQGTVSTAEILAALGDALRQIKPEVRYDVLSDHRELATPATPEQIKALMIAIEDRGASLHGSRCAVVVATDASYGMMRLMAVHAEGVGIDVGVFRTMKEAEAFLEQPARSS
jgi:hypothetical protein